MAKPPHAIYGKVHCTTMIKFSKKEEEAMLGEYQRSFIFRAIGQKPNKNIGGW
jgi:hypothetical protein